MELAEFEIVFIGPKMNSRYNGIMDQLKLILALPNISISVTVNLFDAFETMRPTKLVSRRCVA